jgi:outer membrane protein
VVLDVKLDYFGVIAANEQVSVAEDAVADYQKRLDQIVALHDQGLRTGIDVATAQSALANQQLMLTRAQSGLATTQAQLVLALGLDDWNKSWQLDSVAVEFTPAPEDAAAASRPAPQLVDLGLDQRTELRTLRLQALSYDQLKKSARGQYLPMVNISMGPSWQGTSLDNLVPNFEIFIGLLYPTSGMNPLAVHGQAKEAAAQRLQLDAQLRLERDTIRQDVISSRAQLASALDEVKAAAVLVQAATKQRDLAQGRYQTGIGDIIEYTDALYNFVNARFSAVQAGFDFAGAKARLAHALGEDT